MKRRTGMMTWVMMVSGKKSSRSGASPLHVLPCIAFRLVSLLSGMALSALQRCLSDLLMAAF